MKRRPIRSLTPLVALVLFVTLAACDAAEPGPSGGGSRPTTLAGSSWSVLTVAGRAPGPGAAPPTITFTGTTAKGSGGCNQFGGSYQYDAATGHIAFAELGMTAMACVEKGRMDLEAAYVQALGRATQVDLDADRHLVLSGPGGVIVLAAMIEG
jgi:heat shock protein HslJ